MNLEDQIDQLPNGGWFKPSSRDSFQDLGERLQRAGLPDDVILEVLAEAYAAVAAEYGD